MRHPLWILNLTLTMLVIFIAGFVVMSRERVPAREDIEPSVYAQPIKDETSKINLSKIYENDLFDTYKKEVMIAPENGVVAPIPEPPAARSTKMPPPPPPKFLDPLKISLKGIITFGADETKNRAIIADTRTNKEQNYKVGDTIEDAQLLRIFRNKVIFIRSNGQQEVVYLRAQDAKLDPAFAIMHGWDDVVANVGDNSFVLNMTEFARRVKDLAQFIDMLDLTTVYKQGRSIGCRIGKLDDHSLGRIFEMQRGDVITQINGVALTNSANRLQVYREITALKADDVIKVSYERNRKPKEFTIKLTQEKIEEPQVKEGNEGDGHNEAVQQSASAGNAKAEQIKILEQKHKFAPTLQEIRSQERKAMLRKGKAPMPAAKETNTTNNE